MRIRTVKPEWLEDEKLGCASDAARLLTIALILLSDDHGCGRAHVNYLVGRVWPYGDPPESLRKVSGGLQELEELGFLRLYEVNGQRYYYICNWAKHQKISHKGKPLVPPPPEILRNDSGDPPETLQNDSASRVVFETSTSTSTTTRSRSRPRAGPREAEADPDPPLLPPGELDPDRVHALEACRKFEAATNSPDYPYRNWEQDFYELGRKPPDQLDAVLAIFVADEWVQANPGKATPGHLAKRYARYRETLEGKGTNGSSKRNGAAEHEARNRIADLRKQLSKAERDYVEAERESNQRMLGETRAEMKIIKRELQQLGAAT